MLDTAQLRLDLSLAVTGRIVPALLRDLTQAVAVRLQARLAKTGVPVAVHVQRQDDRAVLYTIVTGTAEDCRRCRESYADVAKLLESKPNLLELLSGAG